MKGELRTIAGHAGTVFVGQLATLAFGITDTVVAGRFSTDALAALSIGAAVYLSVFVGLIGLVQSLLPIWSELSGGGQREALGASVRQSLYLVGAATVFGVVILIAPGPILRATDVPAEMREAVVEYLGVLAYALAPALLFRLFATLNQSLGKPLLVSWVQVVGLIVKVPLSVALAFGVAGLPGQGVVGCAWATVIVNVGMMIVAALLLRRHALYRPYRFWRLPEPPDWSTLCRFLRLGVPTSLAVLVEVTSFSLMSLFIARLGAAPTAAHQIASSVSGALYMMPLAWGIATSARVSHWRGAGDPVRARQALRTGLLAAFSMALTAAAVVALGHQTIAQWYAGDKPELIAIAAGLLLLVAAYHVADAVQAVGVFLLRSYGVAVSPLLVYCAMLWGIGLGGGYLLAYGPLPFGGTPTGSPSAFWIAGAFALGLTALAFLGLLQQAVLRPSAPAYPTSEVAADPRVRPADRI